MKTIAQVALVALFAANLYCQQNDPETNLEPSPEPLDLSHVEIAGMTCSIDIDARPEGTVVIVRSEDGTYLSDGQPTFLPAEIPLTTNAFRLWLGTAEHDVLGDMNADVPLLIYGFGGNDVLFGGSADDRLICGSGDDRALGGNGNDRIWGGMGRDGIFGGDGADEIAGGPGDDDIALHDAVVGDSILLAYGADFGVCGLAGGHGRDWIWGDSEADIVNYGPWDGAGGSDYISADSSETPGGIYVKRLYGAVYPDYIYGCDGTEKIWGGHEQVVGDLILGDGWDDIIYAERGDDTVWGGYGFDQIWGNEGHDSLDGTNQFVDIGEDNDFNIIDGGSGNDEVSGGTLGDWLYGDIGDDTISGRDGDDKLLGEADSDDIYGGFGDDLISAGDGYDRCLGGDGCDGIWGGSGTDTLGGGAGDDYIFGGDGGDFLYGDSDAVQIGAPPIGNDKIVDLSGSDLDILIGEAGNDILIAFDLNAPLPDWLFGNEGTDTFYYDEESRPIGHPDELYDDDTQWSYCFLPADTGHPSGRTEPTRLP